MKRASYRHAIEWLAEVDTDAETVEEIADTVPVQFAADLFDVEAERIGRDVMRRRDAIAKAQP